METYRNDTGAGFWLQFRNPSTGARRGVHLLDGESIALTADECACLLGGAERLARLTRVAVSAPAPPAPTPAPAPVAVVEEPEPVEAPDTDGDEDMTKAEIMAALDDLGVEYNQRDRKAVLADLLADAEGAD